MTTTTKPKSIVAIVGRMFRRRTAKRPYPAVPAPEALLNMQLPLPGFRQNLTDTDVLPLKRPVVFLDEAERLWAAGHARAAAVMLRIAIELKLRRLCEAHRIGFGRRAHFGIYVQALLGTGTIDKPTGRRLQKVGKVLGYAAHGKPVCGRAIEAILKGTRATFAAWEV